MRSRRLNWHSRCRANNKGVEDLRKDRNPHRGYDGNGIQQRGMRVYYGKPPHGR